MPAEGSQLFKVNGNITYSISPGHEAECVRLLFIVPIKLPVHRKAGCFAGSGVAQGGLIDMPDGKWYAYLFRDNGAVGRIPYLVPVTWEDGWPVLGVNGKVPETLDLPASKGLIPGIVASDEFTRKKGDRTCHWFGNGTTILITALVGNMREKVTCA